jgi:hypothetical protein
VHNRRMLLRRATGSVLLLVLLPGCELILHWDPVKQVPSADAGADSGVDAANREVDAGFDANAACDPQKPFGAAQRIFSQNNGWARLSGDGLLMLFWCAGELTFATRNNRDDLFATTTAPVEFSQVVTFMKTSMYPDLPAFTTDDLTLYLSYGGEGYSSIYTSTRPSIGDVFPTPTPASGTDVGGTTFQESQPYPSGDGNALYFEVHGAAGSQGLWSATRKGSAADAGFSSPSLLDTVSNPASGDLFPVSGADDLTLYFASQRDADGGTKVDSDIWVATRPSRSEPFGPPRPVTELNTSAGESPAWISPDECEIYLTRSTSNTTDIIVAKRPR